MRTIKYIAVHCTAGSQHTTIKELQQEFRRKGWKNPGYHYVVAADGTITQLLSEDKVSNGVKGYNSVLINVAYIGGIDAEGKPIDNRTAAQKASLMALLGMLHKKYPTATIQGHRDFSPDRNRNGRIEPSEYIKACPCFDAKAEYQSI
ncbi:N-acetylmuramoyl-L-alanine amidase [Hoylesella saccharolytica]|uniref:N-acetylmuramoyl-L-alanine amidase n=1 Tax=Hoylesella saccharolytica TaxID=633701 RepID=UPI00204DB138|nr:N-acetylmuramoyl-L-alanine amidase [Hoylesella saccharolytica]DAR82670.1 MAG TPA: endodeoxyribonuclease I [Bacteriophage sp.]DAT23825.1 MAG TPA: endodeoxyribonuclease I [Caudoviricetes sp.]